MHNWIPKQDLPFTEIVLYAYAADCTPYPTYVLLPTGLHKARTSSNGYAPRLPEQGTKSSTKQLTPTDPILGPENLLKTGFVQKGLPSSLKGTSTHLAHQKHQLQFATKLFAHQQQEPCRDVDACEKREVRQRVKYGPVKRKKLPRSVPLRVHSDCECKVSECECEVSER